MTFTLLYSQAEAAQGIVMKVKGKYLLTTLGSDDGMMPGERIMLFARKGFEKGTRNLLAVLIVKKVFKNRSWAILTRITNKRYVRKYKSSLRSAVVIFGSMSETSYYQKVVSLAPRSVLLLGGGMTSVVANRFNQYMPEYEFGEDVSSEDVDTFNSDLDSQRGYRAGLMLDIYPLSFYKSGFIWEIFGVSLEYYQLMVPLYVFPHENPGGTEEDGVEPEAVDASWLNVSINLRFPLTISPMFYMGTTVKVGVESHRFKVRTPDEGLESDLRSMSYDYISVHFEENIGIYKFLWIKAGGGIPLVKKGGVQPNTIDIDETTTDVSYDSYSGLYWFASLGLEFKKIQVILEYRVDEYIALAPESLFQSSLNYSHISMLMGYSL